MSRRQAPNRSSAAATRTRSERCQKRTPPAARIACRAERSIAGRRRCRPARCPTTAGSGPLPPRRPPPARRAPQPACGEGHPLVGLERRRRGRRRRRTHGGRRQPGHDAASRSPPAAAPHLGAAPGDEQLRAQADLVGERQQHGDDVLARPLVGIGARCTSARSSPALGASVGIVAGLRAGGGGTVAVRTVTSYGSRRLPCTAPRSTPGSTSSAATAPVPAYSRPRRKRTGVEHPGGGHREHRRQQLARRVGQVGAAAQARARRDHDDTAARSSIDQATQLVGGQLAEPRSPAAPTTASASARLSSISSATRSSTVPWQTSLWTNTDCGLADAPRPVGGLVLDRRVPPPVVVHHPTGRGEVRARCRRPSARRAAAATRRPAWKRSTMRSRHAGPRRRGGTARRSANRSPRWRASSSPITRYWVNTSARSPASSRSATSSSKRASLPQRPPRRDAVAERVRRVVADLLEPGERGQHQPAALHPRRPARRRPAAGRRRPGTCVACSRVSVAQADLLDLVGQVGHERLVGLGAPQQERRRSAGAAPRRRPRRGGARSASAKRSAELRLACRAGRG